MSTTIAAIPSRAAGRLADRSFFVASRLAALVLLVTVLTLLSPYFLTLGNVTNVLRQAALQFVMSSGLTLVVLTGGIDLSVGAVIGLSACLGGELLAGGNIVGGAGAAILAGLACGIVNGGLVAYMRIPSFIATYGMLWIAFGLSYVFMQGEVIYGFPPAFRTISVGMVGPVPMLVVIAVVVLLGLLVVLHRTKLGRAVYAIGGNETAARLSGMPVRFRLTLCYGMSGALAGLAGLLAIARTGAADASLGGDLLLPTIAAVALGGTSLFGGVGGVGGTAIGAVLLSIILNGLNLLGVASFWQPFVMGTIIVTSVGIDEIVKRAAG